jgi:hypothetical protein
LFRLGAGTEKDYQVIFLFLMQYDDFCKIYYCWLV